MAKKKKRTSQYDKEVARIKRQIKALEKRGYRTLDIAIPKTLKGARNLTLEKIYKKSQYIDRETGELLKGERGREIERSERSKKSAKTRAERKRQGQYSHGSSSQQSYYPRQADIILDNLIMLINKLENADTSISYNRQGKAYPKRAEVAYVAEDCRQKLLDIVQEQVREKGSDAVAKVINDNMDDINALLDTMLYYNNEDKVKASYTELVTIIKGGMLSEDELKYWSEVDNSIDGNYGEE